MNIQELKEKVLGGGSVTADEALWLISKAPKAELYEAAHELTVKMANRKFDTCSIINARSGRCSENCKWCAQSAHYKTTADVYPMVDEAETLTHARHHEAQGTERFAIVTSGRKPTKTDMAEIARQFTAIKNNTKLYRCASLGLLNEEELKMLHDAGLQRYHCNLETAPSNFTNLCTTHTQEEKIETLKAARRVGLELCSGGIIGMGESEAQRVEWAMKLHELEIASIPFNLLQPIPGTPLEKEAPLSDDEILSCIAMLRFVNPTAALRFAGGRAKLSHEITERAMYAGINAAIMGDMLTTPGSKVEEDKKLILHAGYSL